MSKEGFWYLATPYSKYPYGMEAAFKMASKVAARLMDQGLLIFCPIAHSHPISLELNNSKSHDFWLAQDQPMIDAAKGMIVAMAPGWSDSTGIQYEIAEFERQRKPITYIYVKDEELGG